MTRFWLKIFAFLAALALCYGFWPGHVIFRCIRCDSKTDYLCDNIPSWNLSDPRLKFVRCLYGCTILKGQWANENITTKRRARFWRGCINSNTESQCSQQFGLCCNCYSNNCNTGFNCATEFGLRLEPNNIIFYVMNFIVFKMISWFY